MSESKSGDQRDILVVDIAEWISKARADPVKYLERQATEVVLVAIGRAPFGGKTYLKGGVLMGLAYQSPRQTADVDMTSTAGPTELDLTGFEESFDKILARTARDLGYLDLALRAQRIKQQPNKDALKQSRFPALDISIGYALRDDEPMINRLNEKQSLLTISVDISFNEPVDDVQCLQLGQSSEKILAYSLRDLIAEKLRAFLQQEKRNRARRQDIYDLALLLQRFQFDKEELREIHESLILKCAARDIVPTIDSIADPALIERARREWETMQLELENELPSFEKCHGSVEVFYRSLPWQK